MRKAFLSVILSSSFVFLTSCDFYLGKGFVEYNPHQILWTDTKEEMTISDIAITRRYYFKSNKSKSKDLELSFSVNCPHTFELPKTKYEIYVNNKKNKTLFGFTPICSNFSITQGKNLIFTSFRHRQFKNDTIRLVVVDKDKSINMIDLSFVIDEKDSIPMHLLQYQ